MLERPQCGELALNLYFFKKYESEEIIKELRNGFLANITSKKRNRKIYISRSKARRRKISNEILIIPLLLKYGIEMIHCEDLTFKEQVELFSETKLLISNQSPAVTTFHQLALVQEMRL